MRLCCGVGDRQEGACFSLSLSPALAACGDGSLDPGEQCDDGNTTSCDGCSSSCEEECTWTCYADETYVVVPDVGGTPETQVVDAYVRNDSCATCAYFITVTVPSPLSLVSSTLSPTSDSVDFELTIQGSSAMSGKVLHPFEIINDGQHRTCSYTAKACPVPGEETTLTLNSWVTPPTDPLGYPFSMVVEPTSSTFEGRRVKERFDASQGVDSCYYGYDALYPNVVAPVARTTPWPPITSSNAYGADLVGWLNPASVLFYRGYGPNFDTDLDGTPDVSDTTPACDKYDLITTGCGGNPPLPAPPVLYGTDTCGTVWQQIMSMRCPNLPSGMDYIDYTSHPVTTGIFETTVEASRDSTTAPSLVWP